MSATPSTKAIVNPTLVGVSAGGAAEGSRTRSGGRLAKTDVFRVSSNQDAVPKRTRLPRAAAGDAMTEAIASEAISETASKRVTPKRRRAGPSTRMREEARTTPAVPDRVDEFTDGGPAPAAGNEEPNGEPATVREDDAYDAEDDVHTTTPEVSKDDAAAKESDDDSVDGVTPQQATQSARGGAKGPPPATTQREPGSPENSLGGTNSLAGGNALPGGGRFSRSLGQTEHLARGRRRLGGKSRHVDSDVTDPEDDGTSGDLPLGLVRGGNVGTGIPRRNEWFGWRECPLGDGRSSRPLGQTEHLAGGRQHLGSESRQRRQRHRRS